MKTIFDFNPTNEEALSLTGFNADEKDEYLKIVSLQNAYSALAIFFRRRKQWDEARKYAELENKQIMIRDLYS